MAGRKNYASLRRFASNRCEVVPRLLAALYADVGSVSLGMLHHDDRVGAFGQGSAGHDFNGFTGNQHVRETLACADFADQAQLAWQVSCFYSESVACGAG